MKFTEDFEAFLRDEVNLNPTRLTTLEQRVETIEDFIANDPVFGALLKGHLIPAGSWAFRTIIKPVQASDGFDADVLFPMDEQPGWLPKDYVENVYKAFKNNATYKDMVQKHKRCVRIVYAGLFQIDLVPYVERNGSHYVTYRLEPPEVGTFELSNPEDFTAWMDERSRASGGTFIKAVRLVKYLRDYKDTFTCVSIILTTLLGEQLDPIEAQMDPSLYADTPSTLVNLMRKLADSLPEDMPAVMDPGGSGDNFTDRYKDDWNYDNFRSMIKSYAHKMEAAYDETDRAEAIKKWRDIFGDKFKAGVRTNAVDQPFKATIPCMGEQFIDAAPYNFVIPPVFPHSVCVSARVTGLQDGEWRRRNGFRQYNLAGNGNRVARNRSIEFTAHTDAKGPYDVYWKVRNGGDEAARASQLRGEIKKQTVKVEPTKFADTHYVECYIVQNNTVVARVRHRVVITPNA